MRGRAWAALVLAAAVVVLAVRTLRSVQLDRRLQAALDRMPTPGDVMMARLGWYLESATRDCPRPGCGHPATWHAQWVWECSAPACSCLGML